MFILGDYADMKVKGIYLAIGIANTVNTIYFGVLSYFADLEQSYKLVCDNHELDEK